MQKKKIKPVAKTKQKKVIVAKNKTVKKSVSKKIGKPNIVSPYMKRISEHEHEYKEFLNLPLNQSPSTRWGSDFQKTVDSCPVVITIKNVTGSEIKNVNIFNFDHEKQRDIIYTGEALDYNKILRFISSYSVMNNLVGVIHIESNTANQVFKTLYFKSTKIGGEVVEYPLTPCLDPLQNLSNVTIVRHVFPLWVGGEVFISTLMANQSVTFSFYLKKVEQVSDELSIVKKELSDLQEKFELLSARLPIPKQKK